MPTDVILVTGGAGFIGSHVVDELVGLGVRVRILDHLHPAAHSADPGYLNPEAEWRREDVRDASAVERALEGVTGVCHQASMVGLGVDFDDVADYVSHNDVGTERAGEVLGFRAEVGFEDGMTEFARAPLRA